MSCRCRLVGAGDFVNLITLNAGAAPVSSQLRQLILGSRFGLERPPAHSPAPNWSTNGRQIRVKKTKRVRWVDYAHRRSALLLENLVAESLHSRPMHFRPEMMFCMVAVEEPGPVVELVITTHAPCNRLVRIAAVMPIVAVQIREAVAKVPKRQKKTDVMPVENTKDRKSRDK